MPRTERWSQKLLDFSARNRLLNIPARSRQVLELKCDSAGAMEDRLAANAALEIAPADPALTPKEFKKRLNDLYLQARTDLEESGVNTLFLALGVLEWNDASSSNSNTHNSSTRNYSAPILLVPVRLERKSLADGVKLYRRDEDTAVNATLVEFLRTQFGLAPQGLDPLPTDESGVDVPLVLQYFQKVIADRAGWAVRNAAFLGCFSFGKFVMWKDMTERVEALRRHPLVNHLIGGGGVFDDGLAVPEPDDLLAQADPAQVFCPVSADSSQRVAVLYSETGKSFVLHGPPGTGKSQTITNIISHNLAKGRRVLFVSEKKAALDVVKARLDKIGLAPFCLELHSNKTEKGRFYAQIKDALNAADAQPPADWSDTAARLAACREELDAYVRELHRLQPNGLTAYDCFAARIADGPEPVKIVADALAFTPQALAALREAVAQMASAWAATTAEAVDALAPVVSSFEWNPVAERETGEAMAALSTALAKNGFAFVPKPPLEGGVRPLSEEEMRAAAARAERLAAKPKWLKGLCAFFAGRGRRRVGPDFAAQLDAARRCLGESRGVMRYRAAKEAVSLQIGTPLAEALARGDVPPERAVAVFDRSFAEKTLEEVVAQSPVLASFTGLGREAGIERFRQLDGRMTELARKMVFAQLAARLPRRRGGPCPEASELGLLRRECEKKTRQKAVRQMLAEARTLVPALKPCFLMSPLSVAQYLPVDAAPFDLIVFDEASQIPVWDAIGVIARGRQLVVVGDPKQMPPTSFFQKGDGGEAGEDDEEPVIEDQESILDECLVAGVFSTYLGWHYRSRHESLIAFSNAHYYDSGLCTFPAASNAPTLGVRFVFVEGGVFDRPKGGRGPKVNEVEARALVDYVCAAVKGPGRRPRSVGIVTFSLPQQRLIRSLLDERRAADPDLERLLPDEGEGACFVKNLENVQGDESDVILFSVGYAPDATGRFTMNFGPLNLAGGERRLNVAITRAKEQVVVFSSIRAAQIDAGEDGRTKAVGVSDLKDFLAYAERETFTINQFTDSRLNCGNENNEPIQSKIENRLIENGDFPDAVAAFLAQKGYAVERGVGCSRFKVDVAVRDPQNPMRYLAGIECDGPSYAQQRTAQDRDLNRTGVLKGLGWRMIRVWSADWAFDRARAEERLLEAISGEGGGEKCTAKGERLGPSSPRLPFAAEEKSRRVHNLSPFTSHLSPLSHAPYRRWTTTAKLAHEDFYEPSSYARTTQMLKAVVETEGPVYEDVMRRRVAQAWGLTRKTDAIRRILDLCMPGHCVVTRHATGRVYWPDGSDPAAFRAYRVCDGSDASRRPVEEIPPEELAAAMHEVVTDCGSCPQDALYKEVMRLFGLGAVTPKARTCLDAAFRLLETQPH